MVLHLFSRRPAGRSRDGRRCNPFAFSFSALLLVVFCGWAVAADESTLAPPVFDVAGPLNGHALGLHLSVLADTTGQMDLHAAMEADRHGRFARANRQYPNFSPSTDPVWLRFDIANSSATRVEWILEMSHPFADLVELYAPDGRGGFHSFLTGDSRPVGNRLERRRTFVFPQIAEPDARLRYYMRIQGSEAIIAALNVWSRQELEEVGRFEEFGIGAFYGVVLGLFAFNLFLWLSMRDQPTRWYLLYLPPMALAYASFFGYTALFLWGDFPWFAGGRDIHFFYFAAFTLYIQFSRTFLDSARYTPKLDRLMRSIVVLGVASTFLTLLLSTHVNHLLVSASELTLILLPVAAAAAWRRGYRPARFYLLATVIFVVTIVLLGLWNFGVIDTSPRFFYVTMSIGTAAELILFSIALADRINILRSENARAQLLAERTLRDAAEELERQVEARTMELKCAMEEAQRLASTDHLTGVLNRRALFEAGEHQLKQFHRYGHRFSVAVFDIDHFKSINDTHGHAIGDAALIGTVGVAREVLREIDIIGRIGGEEFAIVLSNAGIQEATAAAERLRSRLAEERLNVEGKAIRLTASFGVAEVTSECEDLSDIINAADEAMYRAKAEGRNRIVTAGMVGAGVDAGESWPPLATDELR